MKIRSILISAFAITAALLHSCANPGTPMGGEMDETPPVIIKSTPKPNALNFKDKTISIRFDELIKLDDVYSKFVASPPLKERPKITTKGAILEVVFEEDLQENATYTLDFADAVRDNNEGNIYENFIFSFSTGEIIDSMSVSGFIFDSQSLKPLESCMVLLYSNMSDTAFTSEVPLRLAKTDINGQFSIHNIKEGKYKLYAIKDANKNYIFDQPTENIAWLDQAVETSFEYIQIADTLANDSVIYHEHLVYLPDSLQLFLFQEEFKQQYLSSNERKTENKLTYVFNSPLNKHLELNLVDTIVNNDWFILENSRNNDTINVWLTDSLIYKKDTLNLQLTYTLMDSLEQPYEYIDTLSMYFFEKKTSKKPKKKKKTEEVKQIPTLRISPTSNTINIFASYSFTTPTPVQELHNENITLCLASDTLNKPIPYQWVSDSIDIRKFSIDYKWVPGESYAVYIDSASVIDVYGLANKAERFKFTVKQESDYGKILISLTKTQPNYLVQLISTKTESVVRQQYAPANGKLGFRYITPGEYMLKIIFDDNKNEKWDTGNYKLKQQPEKVIFYPEKITIRSNWQHEIPWDTETFDIFLFNEKMIPKQKNSTKSKSR